MEPKLTFTFVNFIPENTNHSTDETGSRDDTPSVPTTIPIDNSIAYGTLIHKLRKPFLYSISIISVIKELINSYSFHVERLSRMCLHKALGLMAVTKGCIGLAHVNDVTFSVQFSRIPFGAGKQINRLPNIQPNVFLVKIIVPKIQLDVH